ncbi:hypothetical protein LCGC14_0464540 [marine sediment metagenome]|uniref:AAA+ ATPase domain-containing protein n=1 Tax=marine sediment metagenome TaxID=412755 RepID=A0A0F9SWU9_9ZZZZ
METDKIDFGKYKDNFFIREDGRVRKIDNLDIYNLIEGYEPPYKGKGKKLQVKNYEYFHHLKKDKSYLIEDFIYPQTMNMLYSPPGGFKSLLGQLIGLSVTNGKDFLDLKTKRFPILICDKENSDQIIKERLTNIKRGHKIRSNQFPLYFITRSGNLDDKNFVDQLKEEIQKYSIKLVIFDTLRRFSGFDENKADEVNKLYMNVFQPIIDDHECSVLLLHHTNKDGNYRGSIDILGMCDTAYSIDRKKRSNEFTIVCEKSRFGEIEKLSGEIDFGSDYIKFTPIEERTKDETAIKFAKEITARIESMFSIQGDILQRKDIVMNFTMMNDFSASPRSIDNSLRWLVLNDRLTKDKSGKYTRKWEGTAPDVQQPDPTEE